MKVLMPVLHYHPVIGGLETWTQNIAERISEKCEIFLVTGRIKNQLKKEVKKGVNISRTSLFSLKNLSYSSPFYILSSLPFIFLKSLFLIKKEKINLLHCQGFLSSFLGYLFLKICHIPYIVTVQRQENKNFLKRTVYRKASRCIAASNYIAKEYFEKIGVKNIEIIPNGIDLKRFENLNREENRKKLGLKDEFLIMTVARLEKVKGIDYLIGAMKENINCKLFIIGEGSERSNLENLVEKLNLKDKVKFIGQISNEKIPEYLAAADCFVLSSLKEGFGIVILEAMAAGVPVIGTGVGGILDMVKDGISGLIIEKENSQSISRAVSRIISDKSFAQKLVSQAKESLKKYNWQNITERVFEIYKRIAL
ncbi:MAG: glycosyltransferase family 4 protein [Candidatus Nealsonbacteria bacterium]